MKTTKFLLLPLLTALALSASEEAAIKVVIEWVGKTNNSML